MNTSPSVPPQPAYFLGCPMWANRVWQGTLLRKGTKANLLADYASVLNTVEGNTTFYGLPKAETVQSWREDTPDGFRFCFKVPRQISHDLALQNCEAEVEAFLKCLAPLGARLGPFFLQVPPHFDNMARLARFLEELPREFAYAVEVRHPVFFQNGPLEQDFDAMLTELGMDRVLFDTQRLMAHSTNDKAIKASQRKKPKVPRRTQALGRHPFLRYVGVTDVDQDGEGLGFWAEKVSGWIAEGRQPYVFLHQVPEDDSAPELCRRFHQLLRAKVPALNAMAEWPGERETRESEGTDRQLSLF